jgi:hypothetical protein
VTVTMFRFTIRDVLWLMVVVGFLGCDAKSNWRVRTIIHGAEATDKHAKEIEEAAKQGPGGPTDIRP